MYSYSQITPYNRNYVQNSSMHNDERFGFLGPFILGGITGGLLAPAFYNRPGYNQPYYPAPVYYGPPCCGRW